uniref:Mitochondrial inner membrane protease subunit 2 n=1 Tax=Strongyloides venezuelensis TaxID=75913 RepID=A0A0K0FAT0_STRVS
MVLKTTKYAAVVLLSGIFIFDRIGYPAVVRGSSMEPTLVGISRRDGRYAIKDVVWINRLKKNAEKLDIIALISPKDRNSTFIKRVSGIEGERVRFHKINDGIHFLIPEHHLCVMSDNINKNVGTDSSNFGPVPKSLVIGKATHIIWPPSHWRKLT